METLILIPNLSLYLQLLYDPIPMVVSGWSLSRILVSLKSDQQTGLDWLYNGFDMLRNDPDFYGYKKMPRIQRLVRRHSLKMHKLYVASNILYKCRKDLHT